VDLILDTCGLLALVGLTDRRLSAKTLARIRLAVHVHISSCSMFELAIKHKRQGLDLGIFATAETLWNSAVDEYQLTELAVTHDIFYTSVALPDHHADPFDRIIIAHAQKQSIPVVSFDKVFARYGVAVLA
jgi:PIN domain nuclease of toxin-antitoxin system